LGILTIQTEAPQLVLFALLPFSDDKKLPAGNLCPHIHGSRSPEDLQAPDDIPIHQAKV
jgi:hypothetical protein